MNDLFHEYNVPIMRKRKRNVSSLPDDLLLAGGVGDNRLGIGGGGAGGGATGKFIKEPNVKSIFMIYVSN